MIQRLSKTVDSVACSSPLVLPDIYKIQKIIWAGSSCPPFRNINTESSTGWTLSCLSIAYQDINHDEVHRITSCLPELMDKLNVEKKNMDKLKWLSYVLHKEIFMLYSRHTETWTCFTVFILSCLWKTFPWKKDLFSGLQNSTSRKGDRSSGSNEYIRGIETAQQQMRHIFADSCTVFKWRELRAQKLRTTLSDISLSSFLAHGTSMPRLSFSAR